MPARKKKEPELLVGGIKPYQAKKGEKYMSAKQQEHFRAVLQAWKHELQNEIDRTIHQMQTEPTTEADPNDRASLETDISLELRSRDREGKLVKKINEAIDRLDEGEYGYCESCGVEIGIQRLEARPTAELCIDCKTLDEIREKQMG
jgi:DnaK suppressor protein